MRCLVFCLLSFVCVTYASYEIAQPVITNVTLTDAGAVVSWYVPSLALMERHEITYKGSDNTVETVTVTGDRSDALLILIRPCVNYSVVVQSFSQTSQSPKSLPEEFSGRILPTPQSPINLYVETGPTGRHLYWEYPGDIGSVRKYNIYGYSNTTVSKHQSVVSSANMADLVQFPLEHQFLLWMTAENMCGTSSKSIPVLSDALQAPGQPNVINVDSGPNSITIWFEASLEGGPVNSYRIRYTTPVGDQNITDLPGDSTEVTLTAFLQSCFQHEIWLYAKNVAGESQPSYLSAFIKSQAVPASPFLKPIVYFNGSYIARWEPTSADDIYAYELWCETEAESPKIFNIEDNSTQAALEGLTQCTVYTVSIRAQGSCGWSEFSNSETFTSRPPDTPRTPVDLSASGTASQCIITWSKGDPQELLWEYELATESQNYESVFYWVPPDATQYTLRSLARPSKHTVYLWAKNACGWSAEATLSLSVSNTGTILIQ
ncbi:hypothetical protein CSKR_112240 [Clonorchis sinensis]|uniref:Fibronectin type-III domain-containing protein n=1 Tax=Clonorchis sinensis TaxID=79923 RepID=A0A8T1M468_CLOSI|nr:hypothetical protein CSKR_112240 [Clonorchis sinensis]